MRRRQKSQGRHAHPYRRWMELATERLDYAPRHRKVVVADFVSAFSQAGAR